MSILIRHVLHKGLFTDVLIEKNRFARIEPEIKSDADTVIDAEGKAIAPAFYNTHTHAAMVLLRGIGEDKRLYDWLEQDIWPLEDKMTPDMVYHSVRLAMLEMIKSGTVFFSDMYMAQRETMRAVDEMGIRAAISPVGIDLNNPVMKAQRKQLIMDVLDEPVPSPRIMKAVSCHAIYTTSDDLIQFAFDKAQEYGVPFHIHAAETREEVDKCLALTGVHPIQYLNKLGVLGPNTVLAHCVHLTDTEQEIVARKRCVVAHCPVSNMKLVSGQMPLQTYLDKGIRVTLGTDGASSNNNLSMLDEMKVAALSGKIAAGEPTAARVADILHLATRAGAEAFGLNAGVIAVGALADFILVDARHPAVLPIANLESHLVYSADSSVITDVWCDGRPVMQDKRVANESEIIDNFNRVTRDLLG